MLFAFLCSDKPDSLSVRMDARPDHLEFLVGLGDHLAFAGPFLDQDGKPNGSLVVVEADDMASAQAIAADDPYAKVGLFADVDIRPWNWAMKNPETK